jgi:hypothetical protein
MRNKQLSTSHSLQALLPAIAAIATLAGCAKFTHVRHTWPDGSTTEVQDRRVNMRTEGSFEFEQATNGTKRVRAGVSSAADAEAGYELLGAGLKILRGGR